MHRKAPYKIHSAMALVGKRVFVKLTKPWTFALAMNIGKLVRRTIILLCPTAANTPFMNRPTIPSLFSSLSITSYTSNKHCCWNTSQAQKLNLVESC
jgi:hypothetical protein